MNPKGLDDFLSTRNLPGVVALGVSATDTLYEGAFGVSSVATGKALDPDTPHAIMSMTKPVTSLAVMRLIESGELALDEPAITYVPAYRGLAVLKQADLAAKTYRTEPLRRAFTLRHLLNHTAGFGYPFCNETLSAFGKAGEDPHFPLGHQPGDGWTYGPSTRILGEIVTAVTGKALPQALDELILAPLGMADTSFETRADQARPHAARGEAWVPQEPFPYMPFGDGGLISTARDYGRFLRCLLQQGRPLVTAGTFRQMVSNQIGRLFITEQPAANPRYTHPFPTGAGVDKFGFGFQLHLRPGAGMRSPGSYGWCGLLNTYFWGDPVREVGGILLMQVLPLYTPVCRETLDGFERRFYAGLSRP